MLSIMTVLWGYARVFRACLTHPIPTGSTTCQELKGAHCLKHLPTRPRNSHVLSVIRTNYVPCYEWVKTMPHKQTHR